MKSDFYTVETARKEAEDLLNKYIQCRKEAGSTASAEMATNLITFYTVGLLCLVLEDDGNLKTNKQKYERVAKQFLQVKSNLQEAMAAAFSQAMTQFSGQNVEYTCNIQVIPEPINKEPC